MIKLQLRPRYTFLYESSGRDGWVEIEIELEALLQQVHLERIIKDGLTDFLKEVELSVLPYKQILQDQQANAGTTDLEEMIERDHFATDSEFVEGVHGFYFFDEVVWGETGLVPPTGDDDLPDVSEGIWPTGDGFEDFRVILSENDPPRLRCKPISVG